MNPALRVVPPSAAQLAADPGAPFIVVAESDLEALAFATAAVGLGLNRKGSAARLVASRQELGRLAEELEARASPLAPRLRRFLHPLTQWQLRTRSLDLARPHIMGILNLTEDSFSGDGVGRGLRGAVARAEELRASGACIVDVGAETARADRPVLAVEDEVRAVAPVVAALVREGHCVSIDTYKPAVARAALGEGAEVVNDISGLTLGTEAAAEAAQSAAGYVLNYSYSVPKKRPARPPVYRDVVRETLAWMDQRLEELLAAGLPAAQIAIDPGIAFGKSHDEDLQILRRLGELTTLGQPILLAHSRKNFIGSVSGRPPSDRELETQIATALAFEQGARIFRVHDAEGARRATEIAAAIVAAAKGAFAPDARSWPWRAGASATHMTTAGPDRPAPAGQRW